jgi:hypothetical protein
MGTSESGIKARLIEYVSVPRMCRYSPVHHIDSTTARTRYLITGRRAPLARTPTERLHRVLVDSRPFQLLLGAVRTALRLFHLNATRVVCSEAAQYTNTSYHLQFNRTTTMASAPMGHSALPAPSADHSTPPFRAMELQAQSHHKSMKLCCSRHRLLHTGSVRGQGQSFASRTTSNMPNQTLKSALCWKTIREGARHVYLS